MLNEPNQVKIKSQNVLIIYKKFNWNLIIFATVCIILPEQFKSDNPSDDQCQGNCQRRYSAYEGKTSAEEADPDVAASNKQFTKEEKPSDYIDIFYSDGKDDMKHFGNYQLEGKKQTKVYGLEDVMRVSFSS